MIRRIMLDLDDTINSFTMSILGSVLGLNVGPYDYQKYPVELGYDIVGAYNKLRLGQPTHAHLPELNVVEFWKTLPRAVWAELPKSPQFDCLIKWAENFVGRENVCILTTPTKCPDSLAGKLEWIHKYLPDWLHRQYLMGPRKNFCARQDTLLIDDSDHQVDAFRAAGGHAILIPRPWNSNAHLNTDWHLADRFRHYEAKRSRIARRIKEGVKPLTKRAA